MAGYGAKVFRFVTMTAPTLPQNSIVNRDGSTIYIEDASFIRLLSKAFQVQYEVLTPSDGGYGTKQPDGNWTGMLGMVIRSEADLAMSGIFVTEERYEAMNFSFPNSQGRVTFMTEKPQPLSKNLVLFHPFSYEIWITLFMFLVVVSLLFYFLMKMERSLQSVMCETSGSIFEQSINFKMKTNTLRMLILIWILGIMILTHSYKAVLLSFLSFPTLSGIKDISDLSKASADRSFQCITLRGSYLIRYFTESSVGTWRTVGECLNRNEMHSEGALEAFEKSTSKKKALIASSYMMAPYTNDYFISEDAFFIMMGGIPFSSKFCCPDRLNAIIHQLIASGLIDKLKTDQDFIFQLQRKSFKYNGSNAPIKLYLDDLSGAFYILMSGWLLSLTIFFAEIFIAKYFSQRV